MNVLHKFEQIEMGEMGMSLITYGELIFGAQKSHAPKQAIFILEELANLIPPISLSTETGRQYGEIRNYLEKKGTPIGNNDLWIAAHALTLGVTLVTNNVKEFSRVQKLKVENWVTHL